MRKYFLLFVFSTFIATLSAQTVENIQVEQNGEKLNINYRIGGSTSEQLYFVTLTCSIDGGAVFEPKSVIGDVGANIRGGKSFNTVVWNVFNDVEEVGNVEFFVKVDLEKDETVREAVTSVTRQEIRKEPEKEVNKEEPRIEETDYSTPPRTIFVGYAGSVFHPVGIRVATLGNWGAYGHFRYGGWDPFGAAYLVAFEAGMTKRFVDKEKFRLHAYLGLGIGDYLDEFEVEYGVLGVFNNRFTLGLGGSVNYWYPDGNISIGIVF